MVDDLRGDARGAYRHIEHSLRLLDELGIHQAVTAQARLLVPLAERCGEPELAAQWRAFVERPRRRLDPLRRHGDGRGPQPRGPRGPRRRRPRRAVRRPPRRPRVVHRRRASRPASRSRESCLGFLAAERATRPAAAEHHAAALGRGERPSTIRRCWRWRWRAGPAASSTPATAASLLGAAERSWAAAPPPSRPTAPTSPRSPTPPAGHRRRRLRGGVRRGRRARSAGRPRSGRPLITP